MISRCELPSFEEGRPRRSNDGTLPHEIGAAGEVKTLLQQVSDLPRHADFKVALHFARLARRPLLEGGDRPFGTKERICLTAPVTTNDSHLTTHIWARASY